MDPKNLNNDPVLSQVAIRYTNEDMIARAILPTVRVATKSGKYFVYDKSDFSVPKTKRAPGSPSNEVGMNVGTANYFAEDHALKEFVADEYVRQAGGQLNAETDATNDVMERLRLGEELELANVMKDTSIITQNVTLSGSDQWDNAASDPFAIVRAARQTVQASIFRRPNTLVLGQQVYDALLDNAKVLARLQGIVAEQIDANWLARMFGVSRVLIGAAGNNTAAQGQTESLGYVWGKNAWLLYVPQTTSLRQISFGWTLAEEVNMGVTKWRDEDRKGTYVRANEEYDQVLATPKAAYLIKNAVS